MPYNLVRDRARLTPGHDALAKPPRGVLTNMLVRYFVGKPIDANTYLVADRATGDALLIDAGSGTAEQAVQAARDLGLRLTAIVATHGHFDHIMDMAALKALAGLPVWVHSGDADMLEHPSTDPFPIYLDIPPVTPDRLLAGGDVLTLGSLRLEVWHTPGHSPGSICLYCQERGIVFSGDTLFYRGWGRTDLPGSDPNLIESSLTRLGGLPPDTLVYPGHGQTTTIGQEGWLPPPRSRVS